MAYSADMSVGQGFRERKSGNNSIPFGVSERQPDTETALM